MDIKYFNNLEDSKSLPVAFDETMDKVFQYIFMEEELYPELWEWEMDSFASK